MDGLSCMCEFGGVCKNGQRIDPKLKAHAKVVKGPLRWTLRHVLSHSKFKVDGGGRRHGGTRLCDFISQELKKRWSKQLQDMAWSKDANFGDAMKSLMTRTKRLASEMEFGAGEVDAWVSTRMLLKLLSRYSHRRKTTTEEDISRTVLVAFLEKCTLAEEDFQLGDIMKSANSVSCMPSRNVCTHVQDFGEWLDDLDEDASYHGKLYKVHTHTRCMSWITSTRERVASQCASHARDLLAEEMGNRGVVASMCGGGGGGE